MAKPKSTTPREKKLPFAVGWAEATALRERFVGTVTADCSIVLKPVLNYTGPLEAGVFIDIPMTRVQAGELVKLLPTEGPLHWLQYRIQASITAYDLEAAALPPSVDVGALQRTMAELTGPLGDLVADYRRAQLPELKAKIDAIIAEKVLDAVMVYGVNPDAPEQQPELPREAEPNESLF